MSIGTNPKSHPLKGNQLAAADPRAQVWLSASAGTGKTQVLSARVIRLLLEKDVRPENLLCITFTKAGAAEMANRINEKLAAWVQMKDELLYKELADIGAASSKDDLTRARMLFSRLLDAPGGGLRITTIHALCQSLLASFPHEAGMIPGFKPMEERTEVELRRDILGEMILDAEKNGADWFLEALRTLSIDHGETAALSFLTQCARNISVLEGVPAALSEARLQLRRRLGVNFTGSITDMLGQQLADGAIDRASIDSVIAMNEEWGGKRGHERADKLRGWLALDFSERAENLMILRSAWTKANGEQLTTKGWVPIDAGYENLALELHKWTQGLVEAVAVADYAEKLAPALVVGKEFAARYEEGKRLRGAIDYDDMIAKTAHMLGTNGMSSWVQYKLDQKIHHILVDESQDTNAAQWSIVNALAGDYFSGSGQHGEMLRTIFSVGDFKQAIFGFQGTAPETYAAAGKQFSEIIEGDEQELKFLTLSQNFRSTKPILDFVDDLIGVVTPEAMGIEGAIPAHEPAQGDYGLVELHPLLGGKKDAGESDANSDGEDDWIAAEKRELADRIADYIKKLVDEAPYLASKKRNLRPGDIMVLLHRRGDLAQALVSRLHGLNVAVAGVDRLKIREPIVVQDLLACIRFVLQPDDEFSLACLLVSPLIGWKQERLLERGYRAHGENLWKHVREQTDLQDELSPLFEMLKKADFTTPYEFLENILSGKFGGRRKFAARLGSEALVPIEELLNACLMFEKNVGGTLQQFLHWFERGDSDMIKREGEAEVNAVRVMTVHGAKGLQAPIVILGNVATDPTKKPDGSLADDKGDGTKLPMLPTNSNNRYGALAEIEARQKEAEMREHKRLLYVAVTRAEERLVMMGAVSSTAKAAPEQSWYPFLAQAMGIGEDDVAKVVRRVGGEGIGLSAKLAVMQASPEQAIAPPKWLRETAPDEPAPAKPLTPSQIDDDLYGDAPAGESAKAAAQRGKLIHALFERITGRVDDLALARSWLDRCNPEQPADNATIMASVEAVIQNATWARYFGPAARSELPFAAVVGAQVISGRIDRIVIDDDQIQLLDFKTGRGVPAGAAQVSVPYLRQMAHYVAAFEAIFPGRSVSAALLYTHAPKLISLSPEILTPHRPAI